jgi:hypothetical protein
MEIKILSSKGLDETVNYGDCIIVNVNNKLVIYDCGSEEFADEVIQYMKDNNIDKADIVLSHNDSDHFKGITKLVDEGKVNSITTLLLLKYVDDIYDKINDKRKTRDSIKKQIEELYSNIYSLSGNNLVDALGDNEYLPNNMRVVGPDKDYFIEAVSKHLDTRESDSIDGETIMNAISVQLEIDINGRKLLLTGDSNFEAIKDKIREYDAIQLPHHGKDKQADNIFEENKGRNNVLYLVSDNTGNSNGGSDNLYKLPTTGYRIKNTKNGEIIVNYNSFSVERCGNLGFNEIHCFRIK